MSSGSRLLPPRQVPTLTEVVDTGPDELGPPIVPDAEEAATLAADRESAEPAAAAQAGAAERIDEQQLTERVLADVQRQIDVILEQRLREMLAPLLARWSEALIEDSREQLAAALREVVVQAVAREFERQRRR